ncbi:NAD-P-binding protein [Multifurca ochricompacta]|uniref:NAD-P-binding protein n=1 Tax=Multifurca ochricompacta TaxID=376703 RepID=A0AAD4QJE5_9AGAM|nr:NAD-P-binding protein [Multifurca ochricompacta]
MSLDNIIGFDENLPVSYHNDVYSAIDPKPLYASQSYKGKVVLVTGASRGIGQETALQYARAGASLAIVARNEESLNETRDAILSAAPEVAVLTLAADVREAKGAEAAVQKVLERFERLDILIANAGSYPFWAPAVSFFFFLALNKKDPDAWWTSFEVNIRGVFNFIWVHSSALLVGAQLRIPGSSDANISKHAVNRLVEFVTLEYPSVRAFALAPGFVPTRLAAEAQAGDASDTPALAAATMLYLTSGRADWLSGRFYSANWDIAEVERDWKDLIVQKGGLINKLYIPSV